MAREKDTWVMQREVSPQGRTSGVPKMELESEVTWGGKEVGGGGSCATGMGTPCTGCSKLFCGASAENKPQKKKFVIS